MSRTKRYLEEISEIMGFGGEINDEVMDRAAEMQGMAMERAYEERLERERERKEKK